MLSTSVRRSDQVSAGVMSALKWSNSSHSSSLHAAMLLAIEACNLCSVFYSHLSESDVSL